MGAAPKVGAADTASKQRVACDEPSGRAHGTTGFFERPRSRFPARVLDNKTNAARRMPRRMENMRRKATPANRAALLHEVLDGRALRRGNAEPLRLDIEMAVQLQIAFMDQDGSAGRAVQAREP